MLGVGVIFGLLSPVSKALLDSGLISPAGLMMTRTAGAAAAFGTASLFVRREPVAWRDRLSLFFAAPARHRAQSGFVHSGGVDDLADRRVGRYDDGADFRHDYRGALFARADYRHEDSRCGYRGGRGADADPLFPGGGLLRRRLGRRRSAVHVRAVVVRYLFRRLQRFDRSLRAGYADEMDVPFATLCWLPSGQEDFVSTRWQAFGWRNFAEVGFIVLGATFLTYLLLPVGQKNLRPTVGCMYNYLQPLVASLVAVLAGMDRFTTVKAAAVVLVFAGVYVVTRSKSKAQMDAEASRR